MSRYYITTVDLRAAALTLQVGQGIAARLNTVDTTNFIDQGEYWAEDQVSEFLGIPLKPVPMRGSTTVPTPPTQWNFPREFILAATYWAVGRMLHSEYFSNEPNVSTAAQWAEGMAIQHIMDFRTRPTVAVGGGRRRHVNPHMPPNIAPREPSQPGNQTQG